MSTETQKIETIYDVDEADFERRVLERSRELPVVVDFWADWCGPCKQLTPALERAATARAGKVELAKVDVEKNRGLQTAFRIQGIPAVKAFRDGRIAAEFTGALPPAQVESFFDSLVPSEADELAASGEEGALRRALELDPNHPTARRDLGRLLLERGDSEEAVELLEGATGDFVAEACWRASSWRAFPRSRRPSRRGTPATPPARSSGCRRRSPARGPGAQRPHPARDGRLLHRARAGRPAGARAPAPPVGGAELS